MSTTFHDVLRWLLNEADADEKKTLATVLDGWSDKPAPKFVPAKIEDIPVREPRRRKLVRPPTAKKRRGGKHAGITGKVWEALQQSSGSLGSDELAQVLDLKRIQTAGALHSLRKAHPSVLKRNWVKGRWDDEADALKPGYFLYQYVGKGEETNGVRHG